MCSDVFSNLAVLFRPFFFSSLIFLYYHGTFFCIIISHFSVLSWHIFLYYGIFFCIITTHFSMLNSTIIILLIWEFFTPALPDVFPQESVRKCLQDSSQYSDPSQQCYCLDGICSSSYFQVLQSYLPILWWLVPVPIIYLFTPWEFFTSALADCLSLESEWNTSSQYSGRSQQCYSLDGLDSSSDF